MGDWVGVAIVLGAAFTLFVLKFIFIRCFFKGNRPRNDLSWVESHSPTARSYFTGNHLYFYPDNALPGSEFGPAHVPPELASTCFGRVKHKPPPSFEKALKCSTPVKLVNQVIVEVDEEQEEPPPTYEECQSKIKASCSNSAAAEVASTSTSASHSAQPSQPSSHSQSRTIVTTEV